MAAARWPVGMFDLSMEVCLTALFGRCRVAVGVTFMLPDWIDREMEETVVGMGRVVEEGRE